MTNLAFAAVINQSCSLESQYIISYQLAHPKIANSCKFFAQIASVIQFIETRCRDFSTASALVI
jgi:hypothetical protein